MPAGESVIEMISSEQGEGHLGVVERMAGSLCDHGKLKQLISFIETNNLLDKDTKCSIFI